MEMVSAIRFFTGKPLARAICCLVGGLLFAYALVFENEYVYVPGLGYAHSPGWVIMAVLAVLFVLAFDKKSFVPLSIALAAFAASMFLEFAQIGGPIWAFGRIGLLLVGEVVAISIPTKRYLVYSFIVTGSYIEAVFIYNFSHYLQQMYFFHGGWTA